MPVSCSKFEGIDSQSVSIYKKQQDNDMIMLQSLSWRSACTHRAYCEFSVPKPNPVRMTTLMYVMENHRNAASVICTHVLEATVYSIFTHLPDFRQLQADELL
jgi:hypothetical protein